MTDTDVTFEVYPQVIKVIDPDEDAEKRIKELLSYDISNAKHIRNYNLERAKADKDEVKADYWRSWDGKKSLYKHKEFPIGFLWRTGLTLRVEGYLVEVKDKRSKPKLLPDKFKPQFRGVLRPYQERALSGLMNRQRGLVDIATGGGKTVIALALMAKRPVHTFVIVPTIELVNEWIYKSKEYLKFPEGIHRVGFASGRQYNLGIFNIINIQSLYNALFRNTKQKKTLEKYRTIQNLYLNADMLIVDEAHHGSAKTWLKSIMQSNAFYRYGFTATADMRTDYADMEYYGLLGEKIIKVTASELVESGHISPARVIFKNWGRKYFMQGTKWGGTGGVEELGIVYNHMRNDLIVRDAWESWMARNRQTIVMVNRLDHGKLLSDLIQRYHEKSPLRHQKGCRIEWLYGKAKNRDEITKGFREGKVNILVCQDQILGEGVDVPDIACVIMGSGYKSAIKTIQLMGRGIRTAEGKSNLVVFDYADDGKYLRDHAEKRLQTYLGESAYQVEADGTVLERLCTHLQEIDVIV